jgi:hypothetical protein
MRRQFAGPRAARIRPDRAVRILAATAAAVLLTACGPAEHGSSAAPTTVLAAASTAVTTTAPTPSMTVLAPTPTTARPSPTPPPVAVPDVVGMGSAQATATLRAVGLVVRTAVRRTAAYPAGTVVALSPGAGTRLRRGSVVRLTVAKAPPPTTAAPAPAPTAAPAPANCDPAYPDACLKDGIGDYDCASGSGNGPNYADGPMRVLPPDPFGLDADGDGVGCENG